MGFVVSNTAPLLALAEIGQFDLLRTLFGKVVIPPAVRAEVLSEVTTSALQAALADGWIEEQVPRDQGAVRLLRNDLDPGESEAIALAQALNPEWVILDDLAARHIAGAVGLRVIGTLGVLLKAKLEGRVPAIRPLLDHLRATGFYLDEILYQNVLVSANESA